MDPIAKNCIMNPKKVGDKGKYFSFLKSYLSVGPPVSLSSTIPTIKLTLLTKPFKIEFVVDKVAMQIHCRVK